MPFIPHTPESLLPRSDSKNPAFTCGGLTSNGRPCRRALSRTPQSSPSPSPRAPSAEAFCWQHRDQASIHIPSPQRPGPIRERSSIDTLVDRLNLLEVQEKKEPRRTSQPGAEKNPKTRPEKRRPDDRRKQQPKQSSLALFCCFATPTENTKAPRPHKSNGGPPPKRSTIPANVQHKQRLHRPPIARDPSSRTGEFMSLIPPSTPPHTAGLLLAELAKPFSELDDEGFIYMFWLTPEGLPAEPPSRAASTLLAPPSRPVPGHRRTSDVLNTFASTVPNSSNKKTMLLKIGRAQNVQRRLNQWTRQCGYNVSLIRYYPYHPSPSGTSVNKPPRTPRKVPNVNRVERLIHIELAGKRAQGGGKCGACGKEHREWFEVDASRNGVAAVDEVIRRWADWVERETLR
ncbi:hypothetical protein LARI1_G009619 [Lachnellula arida]|uniref:Bacteriophage T5 Orf172 DNA-binding domain-containing protein n=1 Tax=Lachnellula arida TaxID=1316785 RepID=A0A8T9B2Y1_9HELO|nr:hypothetical protein LARI1_G009619 [Lachnellula arida]